ncbi:MAG: hypothetical protein EHM41_19410, partial [Chloroflexi bacterium]
GTRLVSIPGLPPDLVALPSGCPFAARCVYVEDHCLEERPPLTDVDGSSAHLSDHHLVACWRWEVIAGREKV